MRSFVVALLSAVTVTAACVVGACSSSDSGGGTTDPMEGGTNGEGGIGSETGVDDGGMPFDATRNDGDTDLDGAIPDDGGIIPGGDPPSVQMIGRFEADGANYNFAFPGSKLIARFNGTDATVKLTQTDVYSVGHSWFNVVVDGVLQAAPLQVNGVSVDYPVAVNLPPGAHTVELEKRTEANLGVVRYEGFTFANGGKLLGPPARSARRIEFLSDSTIDGFGVEGTRLDSNATNYCGDPSSMATNYGALPQFNNARKSMAAVTASTLGAEEFLIAYSGKGFTKNDVQPADDPLVFPTLYGRALPDSAGSTWDFATKPQAVVVSLGGVDLDTTYAPLPRDGNGFVIVPQAFIDAYGAMVDRIRTNYPDAWIFLTVWSQIKDDTAPKLRTPLTNVINGLISARGGDTKLSSYVFPQAEGANDETGCEYHGSATHQAAMAALLSAEIKSKLGW